MLRLVILVSCCTAFHSVLALQHHGRPRVCNLPAKTGPCRANFRRWYFNKRTGRCQTFVFGGCQPNGNNFQTKPACEKRCISENRRNVCSLPVKVGPCKAAFRRWYYNKRTGRCQRFIWGGCQPNGNNFQTKAACERRCPPKQDACEPVRCRLYCPYGWKNDRYGCPICSCKPKPTPVVKPGSCPANNGGVICIVRRDNCFRDSDCPGDRKCCSGGRGCGKECKRPVRRGCRSSCYNDRSCPGNQRCVRNSYGCKVCRPIRYIRTQPY